MAIDSFRNEYEFLSNFYPSKVVLDAVVYPSIENAFQAAKTLNLVMREFFVSNTPGQAKRLGHKVELRPDWDKMRIDVMRSLLLQKFAKGTELRAKLDATKGQQLIEGNDWMDQFWGVCNGVGENHLGKLLMEIRDNVKS